MTSQAQAITPLPTFAALFLGFPLTRQTAVSERGKHLFEIEVPMLFLQGTRDALGKPRSLRPLARRSRKDNPETVSGMRSLFHVPARSGRTDPQVAATCWMRGRMD